MFTYSQNPTILECLLASVREAEGLYEVLRTLGYKIVLVRNREGFDIVSLSFT